MMTETTYTEAEIRAVYERSHVPDRVGVIEAANDMIRRLKANRSARTEKRFSEEELRKLACVVYNRKHELTTLDLIVDKWLAQREAK